jgi:hypothetical protein
MDRYVRPDDLCVLPISGGDTITVRRRLSYGERMDSYQRMFYRTPDGDLKSDPFKAPMAMVQAYLVDWTLTRGGDPWPISPLTVSPEARERAFRDLDPQSFDEIAEAIKAHEGAQTAARDEEKKLRSGTNGADGISDLPFVAAGVSSGSVS